MKRGRRVFFLSKQVGYYKDGRYPWLTSEKECKDALVTPPSNGGHRSRWHAHSLIVTITIKRIRDKRRDRKYKNNKVKYSGLEYRESSVYIRGHLPMYRVASVTPESQRPFYPLGGRVEPPSAKWPIVFTQMAASPHRIDVRMKKCWGIWGAQHPVKLFQLKFRPWPPRKVSV